MGFKLLLTFQEKLEKIILECVELTKKFNNEVLRIKQVGMNLLMMNSYTEYMADRVFVEIGLNKYFNSENPFSFMTTIGMLQKVEEKCQILPAPRQNAFSGWVEV